MLSRDQALNLVVTRVSYPSASRQIVPREPFARLLSFDIFFTKDRTGGVRPDAPNPLHRIEIGPGVSLR